MSSEHVFYGTMLLAFNSDHLGTHPYLGCEISDITAAHICGLLDAMKKITTEGNTNRVEIHEIEIGKTIEKINKMNGWFLKR